MIEVSGNVMLSEHSETSYPVKNNVKTKRPVKGHLPTFECHKENVLLLFVFWGVLRAFC